MNKNPTRVLMVTLACTLVGGCAHLDKKTDNRLSAYQEYAKHERSMKVVEMNFASGLGQAGGSVTITGLTSLTLSMPLTPLAAPESEKSAFGQLIDGTVKAVPYAAGAYLGGKALDAKGNTTVNNNGAAP